MPEPLGYLEFLNLMASARLVLTDSGGIQEETTTLGMPCPTLRKNTERPACPLQQAAYNCARYHAPWSFDKFILSEKSKDSGQAPRRPAGVEAAGRGVHRAGRPFDRALRQGSGQAQGRGRRGRRELPRGDGTGNSQFARGAGGPVLTTGGLWQNCWACRWR